MLGPVSKVFRAYIGPGGGAGSATCLDQAATPGVTTPTDIPVMTSYLQRTALAACLGVFLCSAAVAQAQTDPLDVRVAVENQQPGPREVALRQALGQMLVRLTGRDEIVSQPAVAELLRASGRFVQRYGYEAGGAEGLKLVAQFDVPALRRALAAQQVPVWEEGRAPVLVWLAVERAGQRLLIGADEAPELREQLEAAAQRRGVHLMFPLLDAEDRRRAGFADVFGGFRERVQVASARYGTPLVLIGRAHQEAGEWLTRWSLSGQSGDSAWLSTAPALDQALEQGMRELAVRLAAEQTVTPVSGTAGADLLLRVAEVRSVQDYARLQNYLSSVVGVQSVTPLLIEADTVVLQLGLETAPERVLRNLESGRTLGRQLVAPATVDAAAAVEHSYRLLP